MRKIFATCSECEWIELKRKSFWLQWLLTRSIRKLCLLKMDLEQHWQYPRLNHQSTSNADNDSAHTCTCRLQYVNVNIRVSSKWDLKCDETYKHGCLINIKAGLPQRDVAGRTARGVQIMPQEVIAAAVHIGWTHHSRVGAFVHHAVLSFLLYKILYDTRLM